MFRIAHILDIGSILRNVTKCRVKSERKPTVEELEGRLMTFSLPQMMLVKSKHEGTLCDAYWKCIWLCAFSGHISKS